MTSDPFNLREQRDSIDDYNEAEEIKASAEQPSLVNPETGELWGDYYQRIYRQEREASRTWQTEHPEVMEQLKAKEDAAGLNDNPPDQGLLDALFGDD